MKVNYYTPEGYQKLKDKIQHLEKVERPKLSAIIGAAIDLGDLSENAEYHAAKETQGLMEATISKLKGELSQARVMDSSDIDDTKALILATVKIRNMATAAIFDYTLVAGNEANIRERKISVESPIGKSILGKSVGDIASVETPGGVMKFELLTITR